jgi:hypothetical protein
MRGNQGGKRTWVETFVASLQGLQEAKASGATKVKARYNGIEPSAGGCSSLLLPSPPAEQAAARQNQAGQTSTGDWAGTAAGSGSFSQRSAEQ